MQNLVIKVTEPRLVELPELAPLVEDGQLARDGYNAQKLSPGENNVDGTYWESVKGNPGIKILLAAKVLVNKGEGQAKSILKEIDNLPPGTAQRHIANCENLQVLESWKESSNNAGLKGLIDERKLELIHSQTGDPEIVED